jgi:hypothetical protein
MQGGTGKIFSLKQATLDEVVLKISIPHLSISR